MPSTRTPVPNAACSFSSWWLVTLRSSVIMPTGRSGNTSSGQVLGAELDGEPARVASHLGGVPAADDGGEPNGDRRALALVAEQLGPGVGRSGLVADGAVGLEGAVGDEAAGVHHPLGDPLPVEVADLLQEAVVLHRRRPARADRALVLVVVDGMALASGQVRPGVGHAETSVRRDGTDCGAWQAGHSPQ